MAMKNVYTFSNGSPARCTAPYRSGTARHAPYGAVRAALRVASYHETARQPRSSYAHYYRQHALSTISRAQNAVLYKRNRQPPPARLGSAGPPSGFDL